MSVRAAVMRQLPWLAWTPTDQRLRQEGRRPVCFAAAIASAAQCRPGAPAIDLPATRLGTALALVLLGLLVQQRTKPMARVTLMPN